MELSHLKTLWLKIIACICSTQNNETPTELKNEQKEQSEQKTIEISKTSSENEQKRMFSGALSTQAQGQLFTGIEHSNKLVITNAIRQGADVNMKINGLDPLQYAIRHKNNAIIQQLIKSGAEIKQHHIDLAESYQLMYQTNFKENDMLFTYPAGASKEAVLRNEIRQYLIIANLLKQEMAQQNKTNDKKDATQNTSTNKVQKKESKNRQNDDDDDDE